MILYPKLNNEKIIMIKYSSTKEDLEHSTEENNQKFNRINGKKLRRS